MSTARAESRSTTLPSARRYRLAFVAVTALCAVAVLLQGLWAGIFLEHDGQRDGSGNWIDVHARGGEVALVLAVLATVIVVVKMRTRVELLVGCVVLDVLLVVEAYLGGLIRDHSKDTLTAVHVPLGMAIMAVAVWLPVRAWHHGD
jgi:hypothetical protein